ncbi:MAG: hypothetical protein QOI71_1976 [Gaiellales bacterium]|nr:hypothetical protein [Gaiellales bacterium]
MPKMRSFLRLSLVFTGLALSPPAAATPPRAAMIGGVTAAAGAARYAAFIQSTMTVPGGSVTYSCTGSLIAPQFVLTAGHCAFDDNGAALPPSSYLLSIGLSDWTQVTAQTVRRVSAIHVYPTFNPATLQGDVAVLTLDQPAPAGTAVIPLATAANAALYASGQTATIMGWGQTSNAPDAVPSQTLQIGTVAIQANATCNAIPDFHPAFDLCTAAAGYVPGICHGDSGGPLVANTPSGPLAIGIASYVADTSGACGLGPDFFIRASSIQPWAASVIDGGPVPPPFIPPFAPPAPTLALNADGVVATFTDLADPATLLTGFVATLFNPAGVAVASQQLPPTATSVAFPSLQPGSYAVSIVATYTEGASVAATSAGVTLAPPANTVPPSVTGKTLVGSTLNCQTGTWAWPGTSTLSALWLLNGDTTGISTPTYRVRAADVGKKLSCQVLLKAATGPTATATSAPVLALVKLAVRRKPHLAGSHGVGSALKCLGGTWAHSGSLKLAYVWLRDGKLLHGPTARAAKRTIAAGDAGHRLSCRVKAKTIGQNSSATTATVKVTA